MLLMVALAGCFGGGCYPSAHQLGWSDPVVAETLAGQAGATAQAPIAGLPVEAGVLPTADGTSNLTRIELRWPAATPEMQWSSLALRIDRDGGLLVQAAVDAHIDRAELQERTAEFLAMIGADEGMQETIVAGFQPARHDFSAHWRTSLPAVDLARLASIHVDWQPLRVGAWQAADQQASGQGWWHFEASVQSWRAVGPNGEVAADAAGWVQGPAVRVQGGVTKRPPPDWEALQEATASALTQFGLAGPPTDARVEVTERLCVD